MSNNVLSESIKKLSDEFMEINWEYEYDAHGEKIQLWPGTDQEDIMICVYKGRKFLENFHRQNFFFFNFAYKGCYSAFSHTNNNRIVISEGECYIGQPFTGYAINDESPSDVTIIGVLIRPEAFFKTYFHVLSGDKKMFSFFLNPQKNKYSDEFIKLKFDDTFSTRHLLELMIVEYNTSQDNSQEILKTLTLSLMMQVARQYAASHAEAHYNTNIEKIVAYIGENFDHVTLSSVAEHFSYHPNYVSNLLSKELGKSFSQIVLEQRMERAKALLSGTSLSVAEVAEMVGYMNTSSFHRTYKGFFGVSPREKIL